VSFCESTIWWSLHYFQHSRDNHKVGGIGVSFPLKSKKQKIGDQTPFLVQNGAPLSFIPGFAFTNEN